MTDLPQKPNLYYDVLCQLPPVHLNTLRKLLDHLKEVTSHANINLATVENLSKVFGPTVFTVDKVKIRKRKTCFVYLQLEDV